MSCSCISQLLPSSRPSQHYSAIPKERVSKSELHFWHMFNSDHEAHAPREMSHNASSVIVAERRSSDFETLTFGNIIYIPDELLLHFPAFTLISSLSTLLCQLTNVPSSIWHRCGDYRVLCLHTFRSKYANFRRHSKYSQKGGDISHKTNHIFPKRPRSGVRVTVTAPPPSVGR